MMAKKGLNRAAVDNVAAVKSAVAPTSVAPPGNPSIDLIYIDRFNSNRNLEVFRGLAAETKHA